MSRVLIALSALIVAGCATSYDKSAMPNATAAMRQETAMCEKEQTPTKFTAAKFMACRVAAERNFVMAIHLPKMETFDTYADKMLALAADYDAGHINLKRMGIRAASIRSDFLMACNCGLGGRRGYDYNSFVPSSDLTPPGVQLAPSKP